MNGRMFLEFLNVFVKFPQWRPLLTGKFDLLKKKHNQTPLEGDLISLQLMEKMKFSSPVNRSV